MTLCIGQSPVPCRPQSLQAAGCCLRRRPDRIDSLGEVKNLHGGETMKRLWKVFVAVAALGAVSIHADTVAYTDPANQGNQAFPGNVALDFQVLSPTTVTALGAFNAVGNGLITGNIQ